MKRSPIILSLAFVFASAIGIAQASWYDDYNDGLAAVRSGNWSVARQKMTAAIAVRAKENNKERAYGTIFYNYHPYYYRGVANLNLGDYQQAISDLENATGPGPENLGSIDMLLQMAKTRQQAGTTSPVPPPAPQPQPQPQPQLQPQPPAPQPPTAQPPVPGQQKLDPALRSRAQAELNQARQRIQAAQQRKATGLPQYRDALKLFTDANSRFGAARTEEDLQTVISNASNAQLIADSAVITKPVEAGGLVLGDSSRRVRQALESYFNGDFDVAAQGFQQLAVDMPTNGWIWAFLGASQYSRYAFEAEEQYRAEAMTAFRKARQYGRWGKDGLPSKYFSRRIRRAFDQTSG